MNTLTKAVTATVVLAWATAATAAPITGTLGVADGGTETGASLLSRTSFAVPSATTQAGSTGDFASIAAGQAVSIPTFTVPTAVGTTQTGSDFRLSFQGGSFVANSVSKTEQFSTNSNESITLLFLGEFTPSGTLSAFEPDPASVIGNFNRSISLGNATVSSAFTLASPPAGTGGAAAVPEPASMMLLGTGLLGLGLIRRRT